MRSTRLKTRPLHKFEALGTLWILEGDILPQTLRQVKKRIAEFDRNYSRFREDSLVSRMSKKAGQYKLPPDAKKLFDFYEELYTLTQRRVTPLVGSLLEEAGYDSTYSFHTRLLHQPPDWKESVDYSFPYITLKKPALLDFGAAGKGYIVDLIGETLEENGISSFCINAGGDILTRGEPWTIGLEDPEREGVILGTLELENAALCGSAPNRRKWGRYHHIIDPVTLRSPNHLQAVWVKAKTALQADGFSTALFFVNPTTLRQATMMDYMIIKDENITMSQGFCADLFIKDIRQ